MRCTEHHHTQVHAEVEDLEELRLGESENDDTAKLSERDTTEHLPHIPAYTVHKHNECQQSYMYHQIGDGGVFHDNKDTRITDNITNVYVRMHTYKRQRNGSR